MNSKDVEISDINLKDFDTKKCTKTPKILFVHADTKQVKPEKKKALLNGTSNIVRKQDIISNIEAHRLIGIFQRMTIDGELITQYRCNCPFRCYSKKHFEQHLLTGAGI